MEGDNTNGLLNSFLTAINADDWNHVPGCDTNADFADANKASCKGWNKAGETK